jgi:hypothetical protein
MVRHHSPLFAPHARSPAHRVPQVIKQRMQVHNTPHRSMLACARTVLRTEGLAAFYVSYPTTLTMTVPFTAAQFTVYEQAKAFLNPSGVYSPGAHIMAGGLAGGVAAALTTPLDVAKTLLQTRGSSPDAEIRACRGMGAACRLIWAREGARGFVRGLTPRVVTHMPSNALCWLSYEFFSTSCARFLVEYGADACRRVDDPGRMRRGDSAPAGTPEGHRPHAAAHGDPSARHVHLRARHVHPTLLMSPMPILMLAYTH